MRATLVTFVMLYTNFYHLHFTLAAGNRNVNINKKLYEENLERCLTHKCDAPQPRVIGYKEIFKDNDIELKICEVVHPLSTVLHRCDCSSGYCSSADETCAAESSNEVHIGFFISATSTGGGCASRYVAAAVANHTLCSCQKISAIK